MYIFSKNAIEIFIESKDGSRSIIADICSVYTLHVYVFLSSSAIISLTHCREGSFVIIIIMITIVIITIMIIIRIRIRMTIIRMIIAIVIRMTTTL